MINRKCVESRSARLNCAPYGTAQEDDMGGVRMQLSPAKVQYDTAVLCQVMLCTAQTILCARGRWHSLFRTTALHGNHFREQLVQ